MSQADIIGISVLGLTAIFGLVGMIVKLIVTPVNDLSISVTKLNSTLDSLNKDQEHLSSEIKKHEQRLAAIDLVLVKNDIKL